MSLLGVVVGFSCEFLVSGVFWFSDCWCFGFWVFWVLVPLGLTFSALALGLRTCLGTWV